MMVGTAVLPSALAPACTDKVAASPAGTKADEKPGFASMIGGIGKVPAPVEAKADDDKTGTDHDKPASPETGDDATILLALSAQAAPLLVAPVPPAAVVPADVSKTTDKTVPQGVPAKSAMATVPATLVADDTPPPAVVPSEAKSPPATLLAALSAKPDATPTPTPTPPAPAAVVTDQPIVAPLAVQGSTSAILLARAGGKPVADRAKSAKPVDADRDDAVSATSDAIPTTPIAAPASPALAASPTTAPIPDAGQSLATGGADRQLDLAKDSAWLDGLSRDIASTGDAKGTLRFGLSPQRLGDIQVEMKRGDDGAAITLTTGNAATQAILIDAKPQLLADARAHGLHISDARVDLGGGATNSDSGQRSQARADTSAATTQQGADGESGRHAQQRAQAEPEILGRPARFAMTTATPEKTSVVVNASETDARYA
ncbi:MAG: flagellar hook-length control protein [Sphingomonas bacterium]|nr:flagellar hook-length control protein [Sphingomonas bacterium]